MKKKVHKSTVKTVLQVLMALVLFILTGLHSLFAGEVTFFGPKQYTRGKGKPVTIEDNFTVPLNYAGPNFKISLINGSPDGNNRVSSAEIKLNGEVIFAPKDFNQQVGTIENTVELNPGNVLSVTLYSKPDSYLIINIHKFIDPPGVSFTANPGTIQYQESSTLSWDVVYADAISIDNGIGSVEPMGSLQVSPGIPTTSYTLTAVNLGGTTTKQVTVTVIFPVPAVTLQAAPIYIKPGNPVNLTWTSFAAHTVSIEPNIGAVELNGSLSVKLSDTTIFTITALGYGGSQTAPATVYVDGIAPVISISEPPAGAFLPQKNITLKGSIIDNSPVTFFVNDNQVPLGANNEFEVSLQLEENLNTIQLKSVDAAINTGTLAHQLTVDTIKPAVSITFPQNNAYLNTPVITVKGSLVDVNPDKVILNINNSTLAGIIESNGSFRVDNVQLSSGMNQLSVKAIDKAGNQGQASVSCTLDQTAPVISITEPANNSYFNTPSIMVKGTVQDSSPLTVKVNGAEVPLQNNTFETPVNLNPGENTIHVEAIDAAANPAQASVTCTLDQIAPVIVISSPQEGAIFNEIPITITGTVTDENLLKVLLNNQIPVTVDTATHSFVVENVNLVENENQLVITAEDKAGNISSQGVTVIYIPDNEPPVLTITSPTAGAILDKAGVTVTGTVTDKSNILYVKVNGIDASVDAQNNTYTVQLTLAEGENAITVESEDQYNNKGSISINLRVDTIPPQVKVNSPAPGSYFTTAEVVLSGEIIDATAFSLWINGQAVPPGNINGSQFNHPFTLAQGANQLTISAQDAANHTSQTTLTLFLDSVIPQVTILSPQSGSFTNKDKININGSIIETYAEKVTLSGGSAGSVPGEMNGSGFYFYDILLSEGENIFTVVCRDKAGNSGQAEVTVIRDSQPPQLTVLQPVNGAVLPVQSVLVKGTAADANLKETRVNNNICPLSNNQFSLPVNLVEGANIIVIKAFDLAGNFKTETLQVTVDTIAPNLNIASPTANAVVNTTNVTVSGRVDEINLPGVTVKVNGQAVPLSNNEFSVEIALSQEGKTDILVEASDAMGNQTAKIILVTRDTQAPSIVKVEPGDQFTGVPLSYFVRVELSEPIASDSLNSQGFYLQYNGQNLEGTISLEGNIFTFKPLLPFPSDSEITVHITNKLKDAAGNILSNPRVIKFFTRDQSAPSAPVLEPIPEQTALKKVTISGASEPEARITIAGGLSEVRTQCNAEGGFSSEVLLKENQLNQLCVYARDASGNESTPACAAVYQQGGEFVVTDAQLESSENKILVDFSRGIAVGTLTADNIAVTTASGVQPGTLTTADNNTRVIFTAGGGVDLSSQPVMLEVKTGIADMEGIFLSYPFNRVFNQEGGEVIAQGEVYDDKTGLPLPGSLVQLISVDGTPPPSPAPSAMTTGQGRYVLVLPVGQCVLRTGKENYTYSDRVVLSASGYSTAVFDSRLAPLNPEEQTLTPEGGVIRTHTSAASSTSSQANGVSGALIYPEGALDAVKKGRITPVGVQALQGRLPSGWSPLAVMDIRVNNYSDSDNYNNNGIVSFLKSCELRAFYPGYAGPDSVSSSTVILAYWDEGVFNWKTVGLASLSPEYLSGMVEKTGQYAFLIADTVPMAPPQPTSGQAVPGVTQGSIPGSSDINTKLTFTPSVIYPGETSTAVLTINPIAGTGNGTVTAISSGVPVQARITERYNLLSGPTASFVPYTADLTAYNYSTSVSKVEFSMSPNRQINLSELKMGFIKSDLVRYSAGVLGMVVGADGGTVTGDGGAEIAIEANSVKSPIAVSLKKQETAGITAPLPAGFQVIGALELSLGGARLLKPAVISLLLSQEEINSIPAEAQLLVVKQEKLDVELSWVLQSKGLVESGRIKSFIDSSGNLPFEGVKQGGTYLFLQALSPLGYITGNASKNAQPVSGAVVSVANQEIKAVSAGTYVQVGFIGNLELTALDLASRDKGSGAVVIENLADIVTLNLNIIPTGPQVLSITPADNAEKVPLNSRITFIFSEPVHAATFNENTIYIKYNEKLLPGVQGDKWSPLPGAFLEKSPPGLFKLSTDGKQGEFVPGEDFPSDSVINITVTTNLKDLQGNPMSSVFSSSFTTIDVIPPVFDPSKITVYMPENGTVRIRVEENILAVDDMITVFNPRTGKSVSYTVDSTGSFVKEFAVDALVSDQLKISVFDKARNETVLEPKPLVSADGKRVLLDGRAAEFIADEGKGPGIKIDAGTFAEPTVVGVYEITDFSILAPQPADFQRLKALTLNFGGKIAGKPVDISIPVPDGISEADMGKIFFAREVEVLGQKRVMIIDSAVMANGRIYTACAPFEDYIRQFDGTISVLKANFDTAIGFISGTVAGNNTVVLAGDICYIPDNYYYVFPVPINTQVNIVVKDLYTAETIYEKTTAGPSLAGQVYRFEKVTNQSDKEPPMIGKSTGIMTFGFDVARQTISNQGITITPKVDDAGNVTGIRIDGAEGTAATKIEGDGTPFATIRVYKLKKEENSDKFIYKEIQKIEALYKGNFSQDNIEVKQGDKVIITVEKGGIALNQEFVLSFSEPLDTDYESGDVSIPISIHEYKGDGQIGDEIPVQAKLPEVDGQFTGTEVMVKLENKLDENRVYVLKTEDEQGNGLCDRAGNALKISCNFRARRSYGLFEETGPHDVLDTVLIGSTLFVASGFQGIRIFDVSNPANIQPINPPYNNFSGKVQGLAKYRKDENSPYQLMVVGGGSTCLGFIKVLDISNLYDIKQLKSQIISDNQTDAVKLPQGHPRYVQVLGHYAFVTIRGAGLAVVDIDAMTTQSDMNNLNAVLRYHHEEFISEAAAYKRIFHDPNTPEDPDEQILAVVLVNNYGIKILDMNRQANEDPNEPYSRYNMLEVGSYRLPSTLKDLLTGLVLVEDYWVDVDEDNRRDDEEDNDKEEDMQIKGENISAKDELKDMVFFAIPAVRQIVVLDITGTGTSPNISPGFYGTLEVKFKNEQNEYKYATALRDMEISTEDQVLYATDMQMGLVILDMSISGKTLYTKTSSERFLGSINTSGHSQYGLTIDPDLKLAVVGQDNKGVDVIKLGNPEIKLVYLDPQGKYRDVQLIAPSGLAPGDIPINPETNLPYSDTVYVMAILPGGIGQTITAELWAQNFETMPIHEWDDKVKTVEQVILTRMSNDKTDNKFNMFISEPVLITLKPDETSSSRTLMSGNFIQANFDFNDPGIISKLSYIDISDLRQIYTKKPSINCEWLDGDEPNPVNNPSTGMREVSHTGPSLDSGSDGGSYSSLYLHSGEFYVEEVDAAVPGRGFDFVFKRRYESRATYSGVLGWGWDHQYNTRLVELYTGDILYFDGNGRRERYKAIKNGVVITGYESPIGYFTQLVKRVDGTFCIKYAQGFLEIFNSKGRLICLQDTNNNKMFFYYDISGQLAMIKDTLGKEYVFEYYPYARNDKSSNRLKALYVMNEYQLLYEYDNYGRLIKVTRSLTGKPNISRGKQYDYYTMGSDIKLSYNLKSITDAKNQKYLAVEYDSNDKVKSLTRGTDKVEVTPGLNASTSETRDGITIQRLYFHNNSYHIKTSEVEGYLTHYDYNSHGLITKIAYPLGNQHHFIYDDNNSDWRARGNLRFSREIANQGGGMIETEYRYQSYVNRVNYIKDGLGNETNLDVDSLTGNVNSVTFADTTNFQYKYNSNGQLIREIIPCVPDPETGLAETTNTYTYYPDTFPVMGGYLGKITMDKDGDKITREFQYNRLGDVVLSWDGEGVASNYEYEDDYTKVTVIEGSNDSTDTKPVVNFTTVSTFDANLNLETEKSAGILTTNTYDMLNRIKTLTRKGDSDGKTQSMSFNYDSSGNLSEIINPRGFKDTFKYNDRDLVTEKHLGNDLSLEKYQYNGNGQVEYSWDGENKMTTYKYDGFARLHEIIDPKQNKMTYDYDNNSNQTLMEALGTDGKSLKFEYEYNNVNQLTYKKLRCGGADPCHRTTEFDYTPAGDVASVKNPRQYKYEIRRTGSGLVHKIIDPLQNYTEKKYDGRGLVKEIKKVDKKSQDTLTTAIDYDKLGKMSLYNDDLLRKYETLYNPQHQRPETFKNPKEGETTYKYDGLGRVERVIKTVKSEDETRQYETVYGFDANNNVVSITDPRQNKTTYEYDELDRVKKVTYPEVNGEQAITETTYYGNHLVKTHTDSNGTVVTHTYDDAGRLTKRDINRAEGVGGVSHEEFEYDGLGRLKSAKNQYSKVIFDYNEEGCQVSETLQWLKSDGSVEKEFNTGSQYDANANRTLMKYPYEEEKKTVNTTWDELDRIDEIICEGKRLAKYIYDGEKKVIERYLSDSIVMVTQYDLGGRPENVVFKDIENGKVIFSSDAKYDSADNIEWKTALDQDREELEYNSENNLVKSEDGSQVTHFHLDGAGNLKKKEVNRKGVLGIFDYEHNERNQLTALFGLVKIPNPFIKYDKNGNLTKDWDGTIYTYDWNNRMVKAETPDDTVIEFLYDALGRLIKKLIKVDNNIVNSETYSYDGERVIEDYNHQMELVSRYTYGNELDERVQIELSNSPLASYIPITDRVGSVVALVTEEGQLVERVKYATYGKPTFIYDDAPPRVDVVRLESLDSSLFIRFSEPINKEKAETAIKLSKGTIPISGSITFADDNQAAIFTGPALPVNETLNITITTDLTDEFSNQLSEEFSQDFINTGTDLNIYDRAAPTVTEIRKIGPEFYVTFNEEMSSTTATGAVELTSAQGVFTGDCAADPEDTKTIRFTPGKALSIDVEYTVAVKSNTAADLSGKGLNEEFSRSFLNEGKDLFIYEKPNPNEHETSRVNNNCLFQGSIYHPELGLYYFRSRFYSPVLGRFLQTDPMGYQDSFNLYEAFNNNPLNYVDPYGMSSKKHGVNPLVSRSAYSKLLKYYRSKGMPGDAASDQALADLVKYGYIEDKSELKLGIAVTAGTGFFYNAMHYVALPMFELSPAGIFKDAVSLPFGKDLVYGTKLKWWNYAMVAAPILYETFKIGRGLGLADEFLDIGDFLTKTKKLTVTAYRAQGRPLISIDELGNVKIARPLGRRNKGVAVHVGFDKKRARMWIRQKNRSQLIEFEVKESFFQKIRRTAQPEHGVIRDRTRPWRVDVKYPDQYAIPPSMLDEFEAAIVKGSGRIIHN